MASTAEDLKYMEELARSGPQRNAEGLREITYRDALREAIEEELERDPNVLLMGEDIGAYGGSYVVTRGFQEKWGRERVIDTPIAELGIVGAAVGAAMGGLRPVVELMTINFSLLAIDQIVNHAAKIHHMFGGQFKVPMVIRTASGWGQLGATHSQTFEGWYAHIPGLRVVMPSTPMDAKGFLKAAIRGDDPVHVHRALADLPQPWSGAGRRLRASPGRRRCPARGYRHHHRFLVPRRHPCHGRSRGA